MYCLPMPPCQDLLPPHVKFSRSATEQRRSNYSPICDTEDYESVYEVHKSIAPSVKTVIYQNLQHVPMTDCLFYTPVSVKWPNVESAD